MFFTRVFVTCSWLCPGCVGQRHTWWCLYICSSVSCWQGYKRKNPSRARYCEAFVKSKKEEYPSWKEVIDLRTSISMIYFTKKCVGDWDLALDSIERSACSDGEHSTSQRVPGLQRHSLPPLRLLLSTRRGGQKGRLRSLVQDDLRQADGAKGKKEFQRNPFC